MANGPKLITTAVTETKTGPALSFTVAGVDETLTVNLSALSDEVRDNLIIHGLRQKISDGAAISKALEPTPLDKFNRMKSIADRLLAGDWVAAKGDGTTAVAGVNWLAYREYVQTSLSARKQPVPDEATIRANYDKLTRSEVLALKTIPAIGAIIARIQSERGAGKSKIDADSLLAGFID